MTFYPKQIHVILSSANPAKRVQALSGQEKTVNIAEFCISDSWDVALAFPYLESMHLEDDKYQKVLASETSHYPLFQK
jgi:hypothetical protein